MRPAVDLSSSPSLGFFLSSAGALGGRLFTFTTRQKRMGRGLALLHRARGEWLLVPSLLLWAFLPLFIRLPPYFSFFGTMPIPLPVSSVSGPPFSVVKPGSATLPVTHAQADALSSVLQLLHM